MIHRLSLLVLVLHYITIPHVCLLPLVNGDEALITEVCHGTPDPDACQQCLSKAPGSNTKDEKGLAGISIKCSLSLSNVVFSDFDEIADGTGDDEVKILCERCQESIGNAIKSLMDAQVDLTNGQFDDASHQLVVAGDSYNDCSQIFQNIPAPAPFENDFSSLKIFYLNTQAILNHF